MICIIYIIWHIFSLACFRIHVFLSASNSKHWIPGGSLLYKHHIVQLGHHSSGDQASHHVEDDYAGDQTGGEGGGSKERETTPGF